MTDKLKPCQRCDKEAGFISYVKHVRGPNKIYQGKKCVVCLDCGFTVFGTTETEAIAAWNKRQGENDGGAAKMEDFEGRKEQKEPVFSIDDRGYNVKAWYLTDTKNSKGDALIEICKDNVLVRQFLFSSYKIWNISAHFSDIVDGEIVNSTKGYEMAVWTGFLQEQLDRQIKALWNKRQGESDAD